MRFGVFLPPFAEYAEPEFVAALAGAAEVAGWDGFFLWDHMLADIKTPYRASSGALAARLMRPSEKLLPGWTMQARWI